MPYVSPRQGWRPGQGESPGGRRGARNSPKADIVRLLIFHGQRFGQAQFTRQGAIELVEHGGTD